MLFPLPSQGSTGRTLFTGRRVSLGSLWTGESWLYFRARASQLDLNHLKAHALHTRPGSPSRQFLSFIRPPVKRSQSLRFNVFWRLLLCPWELIYRLTLCACSYFHWFVLLSLIVAYSAVTRRCKAQHSRNHKEQRTN